MRFLCITCGAEHELADVSFGASAPAQWDTLSDEERAGSELTSDQCVIESREGRSFYVRACLDIPIKGTDPTFTWGVWTSLSEDSFLEVADSWDDPRRVDLGPYFSWLCTPIPTYPDTMFMKASVHQRAVGLRPLVMLDVTDHLLSIHQRDGIARDELEKIVQQVLHT